MRKVPKRGALELVPDATFDAIEEMGVLEPEFQEGLPEQIPVPENPPTPPPEPERPADPSLPRASFLPPPLPPLPPRPPTPPPLPPPNEYTQYELAMKDARGLTHGVARELKSILQGQSSKEGEKDEKGVECGEGEGGEGEEETVKVSKKRLRLILEDVRSGNRSIGHMHRIRESDFDRVAWEKSIIKYEMMKDIVDREACYTHTLQTIQSVEGLSGVTDTGVRVASQINLMLGGLTSPPSLHFYDAQLCEFLYEQDLAQGYKVHYVPHPDSFNYLYTAGFLDPEVYPPGSLAANVAFTPEVRNAPPPPPTPLEVTRIINDDELYELLHEAAEYSVLKESKLQKEELKRRLDDGVISNDDVTEIKSRLLSDYYTDKLVLNPGC